MLPDGHSHGPKKSQSKFLSFSERMGASNCAERQPEQPQQEKKNAVTSASVFWEKKGAQLPLGEITESHFMSLFTDCPAEMEKFWASNGDWVELRNEATSCYVQGRSQSLRFAEIGIDSEFSSTTRSSWRAPRSLRRSNRGSICLDLQRG
jgi:hypothetical protein